MDHSPSWEANQFSQLVKKFPAFHGTRRFITTLTSAHQLSLSWARLILSMSPHPTSWRSILILSSHLYLGLPSGVFPSGFLAKTLHTLLLSPICATRAAHLILLNLITWIILGEDQHWCYIILAIASIINLLALEFFFFNFSTPCIWNVNNAGTKYIRIVKQTAFWREKKLRVYNMFKIFGTYICWINI